MFATKGWLKVTLFVVGVLVVGLGMYAGFQVQEAEATGGRVRQYTVTYIWSKPLWGTTDVVQQPCEYTKKIDWMANPPRPLCSNQSRSKEIRYRFYDLYEITETYVDTGDEVYMIESSKEFLRREKREVWSYWGRCESSQCPSHHYNA